MAQRYESVGTLVIDGDQEYDIQSNTLRSDAQLNDVMTAAGFAGVSQGPGFTQIDIQRAVPKTLKTADLVTKIGKSVNVQFFMGGYVWVFDGEVYNGQITGSATANAQHSAMIKGEFVEPVRA